MSTVEQSARENAPAVLPSPASTPATAAIDVSIVVVTWNSGDWIEACLRAIPPACEGLVYETIVFDNASGDSTAAIVSRGEWKARLLASPSNRGFAAGLNGAIRESRGRYVFLLNPDCEPAPLSVKRLVEHLEKHQAAAAAAPLLIGEDGKPQSDFQLRRLPTLASLLAEILLLNELLPGNPLSKKHHYGDLDIGRTQPVEQPAAAALLIRRSILNELGEFDENFAPAWFEDVDYCRRLAEADAPILLVPTALATHHGGASLAHLPFAEFIDVWYRNLYRYAKKWMPALQVELIRWAIVSGMLLRAGASSLGIRANGHERDARAYLRVARKALRRWAPESRLS